MNITSDFRKYATGHLRMNGMALDDVMNAQAQYLNPYILEERQLNVTQMDVVLPPDDGQNHFPWHRDK